MANAIPVAQKDEKPPVQAPADTPRALPKGFEDLEVPKNARKVVVVPGMNGAAPSVRVDF